MKTSVRQEKQTAENSAHAGATAYLKRNAGGEALMRELALPMAALLQGPSPEDPPAR